MTARKKPAVAKQAKKKDEPIMLGELTQAQRERLAVAQRRTKAAELRFEEEKRHLNELLAMAMPAGANNFDPETGCFWWKPPVAPDEGVDLDS